MAKLLIDIQEESPCNFCGDTVPLDVRADMDTAECPSCNKDLYPRFTHAIIYTKALNGELIDARQGGLVLGRDTPEDDIPMVIAVASGVFQVYGLMQGGEYILNSQASSNHRERLEEMIAQKGAEYEPLKSIEISDVTRVFNTNHKPAGDVFLLIDHGQFIVSRAGTARFYKELEELNNSVSLEEVLSEAT